MSIFAKALEQAIRDFTSADAVLSDDFLREAAVEWVLEHDLDVLEHLRDTIDLDDAFSEALQDLDYWSIW